MTDITRKKILLVAPEFFGYYKEIVKVLQNKGAEVYYYNSDPSDFVRNAVPFFQSHPLVKSLKISEKLVARFEDKILYDIKNKGEKFDLLIVINGKYITSRFVNHVKQKHMNEESQTILYYWDSRSVLCDDVDRIRLFDRVLSFDPIDCSESGGVIDFLPLFYIDAYVAQKEYNKKIYDLTSIGSYKYNRYILLDKIKKVNMSHTCYFFQYNSLVAFMPHKLFRPKYRSIKLSDISFSKLNKDEISKIYAESKAVLDIPMEGQNGLTMRTFECLGSHMKMITTNRNIVNYDFYKPEYIAILGDDCKLPDISWFDNDRIEWPDSIINKYSINAWINNLLG